ncbi:MAG: DNA gyrase subunit A [Candidatus Enterosoma sp.]|nr:DNA gyrase subunit A [Bacilli bacterium]MDY3907790.1 DNA gyrase subunit A [Candidatus Enterosoma sp.]
MIDEEKETEELTQENKEEIKEEKGEGISGLQEGIVAGISKDEFQVEMKNSFLDYAVSTLTSRAIPDARDGLKPVQRRIIYDMWDMNITPDKPFKKSARVSGDVMGKYHPHGDSSIYLAMCRMAQDFAMRYTLIQGHGNFGSPDGDEPAAARYTEARLSKIAMEMTRDIDKDTVPFVDTYDSEGKEPTVLPSRFPNLLCNETSGIAVGMATSIPPHNLKETIEGIQMIIRNPETTTLELMNVIKGPDFPSGGLILGRAGIRRYFDTGRGSVKVRGKYFINNLGNHFEIVFTELPYMVNKRELAKKIVTLADSKMIEGISSVADYSSAKMGTKFTIVLKKGANPDLVLNHLFRFTPLQSSFAVNMLALDNGTPKVLSMRQAIDIYIKHQQNIITNRTKFLLKKAESRIHILNGIIAITDAIDEAIHIIRSSKTNEEASLRLKERFSLDDEQCKAIMDMTLKRLTGLEYQKYIDEKNALLNDCQEYHKLLDDYSYLQNKLIEELEEIKRKYGDDRRTEISDIDYDESDEDLIQDKEILILLTDNGYIKRVDPSEFKIQNRGGIGVKGFQTKDDDTVKILRHSKTKTDVLFFTNTGRVYHTRGYQIQEGTRISKGIPIVNFLDLKDNESISSIISMDNYEGKYLFFATKNGVVKRCDAKNFENINSNGKIAISLSENDELLDVKETDGKAIISLASSDGKVCSFFEDKVRSMGRTASGVRGITLEGDNKVVGVVSSMDGNKIFSLSTLGLGKISKGEDYRITNRGSKGVITMKVGEENGSLLTIKTVRGDENIIIITSKGTTIKTSLSQLREMGRNTRGVKMITMRENESISSCCIEPSQEDYEAQEEVIKEDVSESEDEKILSEMIKNSSLEDGE